MLSDSINNSIIQNNYNDDNKTNEMQISSFLHDDNSLVSEEDISEIEEYLNSENVNAEDLKLKASKLIKLVKIKERDLILAAQIGQSLLDANLSMQKQLKSISSNNEEEKSRNILEKIVEEPISNSTSVSSFNQPISRSSSYDISSYTDNLEEVNSKLQDQVEKLEQSMKQNEQQNSKRILLLENLLEQLQNELVELQSMNTELENEKKMLLEEKLSSKRIVETNEENTDTIIAQLLIHKKKLVNTVTDLEKKKKYLEDELLHALNDESKLERELRKLKREAEAGNRFKELYKQQSDKVNELEVSISNYRKNVRRISMGIFDSNSIEEITGNESKYHNIDGISDEDNTSLSHTIITKSLPSPLSDGSQRTSQTLSMDNSLISYPSLEDELEELKEEDEGDYELSQGSVLYDYEDQKGGMESGYCSGELSNPSADPMSIISRKGPSHHASRHHLYNKSDLYSQNGSGVVVIQGRINNNESDYEKSNRRRERQGRLANINSRSEGGEEDESSEETRRHYHHHHEHAIAEDSCGSSSSELVLRERKCYKCGKPVSNVPVRSNHFSGGHHQKHNRRSHSRVMKARAKRTAMSKKRHSVLVPLKSTGEEDEKELSLIDTRNNSFLGIYNSCKAALERMNYSELEVSKSHAAWKFIQFWFAMLCIFIGCIVVSYRRMFQKNLSKTKKSNRIIEEEEKEEKVEESN